MQQEFTRDIVSLEKVFDFLHQFMAQYKVNAETVNSMDLVVEELFTNIVKYNRDARENISITLQKSSNVLSITLVDPNSMPFDITKAPEVNLNIPLEDRKLGKLGIHLVKRLTDSVSYHHHNGISTITVTKRLE